MSGLRWLLAYPSGGLPDLPGRIPPWGLGGAWRLPRFPKAVGGKRLNRVRDRAEKGFKNARQASAPQASSRPGLAHHRMGRIVTANCRRPSRHRPLQWVS